MKKSGIVLMMTLLLITVMMGIVALILSQSSRLSEQGNSAFTQSATMRVINDLERELPDLLSSITGAEQLDLAMRLPLQIENSNRSFSLKAMLDSPYTRLNINNVMKSDGAINEPYVKALNQLFAIYPIADTDMFFKLLFDTIDSDTAERNSNTEIALNQPDFKNGSITDDRQFYAVLERYVELTGDKMILSIPWNSYFGYEGEKMDINAVNPEPLSLILPGLSPERARSMTQYRTKAYETKDEAIRAEPQLATVFDTYFFIYQSGISYNLLCDVQLQENTRQEHVKFQYNLVEKKVKRVEFL